MVTFDKKATKGKRSSYILVVNGKPLKSSVLDFYPDDVSRRWEVDVEDIADTEHLMSCTFGDITQCMEALNLRVSFEWWKFPYHMNVNFETQRPLLNFASWIDTSDWAYPYSLSEYCEAIRQSIKEAGIKDMRLEKESVSTEDAILISFECRFRPKASMLADEIQYWKNRITILHEKSLHILAKRMRPDSLVTLFCFPQTIKTSCEQYLLYFVQFLADLGIKAQSEIKERSGEVLFSVTPQDGPSALEKIKEALEIYLSLPRNPEFTTAVKECSGTAIAQLRANVYFLQSQLALGQAMLETKDATIDALNLTVFQQRQLLGQPSAKSEMSELRQKTESEPILGDTVYLTKYEGKFFKVDLPTILRRLKRSFGIDKDKE